MANSLSIATVIEKNRLSSDVPFLVCLDIDVVDPVTLAVVETMHVVRNNEGIDFNGFTYTPTAFDIELKAEAGAQPSVNLVLTDYSKAVQARMQAYGGGIGFKVTLTVVNADNLSQGPEIVEFFEVVGASAANYVVTFTLGSENALTKTFPRRRQTRDYCQWRYKDPATCKYAGNLPACDLSLEGVNGCTAHANANNFGGFPGISIKAVKYG